MSQNKDNTPDIFRSIFSILGETLAAINKPGKLAAIWLDSPVLTSKRRTRIMEEGAEIKVVDGNIVDLPEGEQPTHKILSCWGAMNHSFSIKVQPVEGGEIQTITL